MDQWISNASVLKDLMELTQGEVHVNSENFITTNKPQRVYVEEVNEELEHIDPQCLYERTTPDLKAIPELLSMVTVIEENEESQESIEISSCHKESNNCIPGDTKLSQRSETVIITSPKHGKMLTDPASMFKKKASPKKISNTPIGESQSTQSIPVSKKEYNSSKCAEQLYREFKTKEEAYKKSQETVWTRLYKDLEERDRKILSKRKQNLPTRGADLT
ncbi:hypothetical protein EVAR_99369_1 [Eumeta japonica]|uniref:Uncharacterized protein n=1 Tax=Eumeta variegata TaxID=151549 RepID=A0A4C1YQG1_EUMVA|nr:hypothetical protein EVAR_99369_1 [Eumeta japonica]